MIIPQVLTVTKYRSFRYIVNILLIERWRQMVELRSDILAAKNNVFSGHLVGANREINKLLGYLHDGETVNYICPGQYDENKGIIVLTDERVIFIKDTLFAKTSQDFPYRVITSVELKLRLVYGDIVLFSESFQAVTIKQVPRNHGLKVVKLIREGVRHGMLPKIDLTAVTVTPDITTIPTTSPIVPAQNSSNLINSGHTSTLVGDALEVRKKQAMKALDESYDKDQVTHTEYLRKRGEINRMQA